MFGGQLSITNDLVGIVEYWRVVNIERHAWLYRALWVCIGFICIADVSTHFVCADHVPLDMLLVTVGNVKRKWYIVLVSLKLALG